MSSVEGADAAVSWCVVDDAVGGEPERMRDDLVPRWVTQTWGFTAVEYFP